jgi:Phosphatidylinositol-specific phospholipase C, X domain
MDIVGKIVAMLIVGALSFLIYMACVHQPEILERFESASSSLRTISELMNKLPLREYCVKSSYNTALTDKNTIDVKNIKLILSKGCRFLDFEIFLIDGGAYVASSTDSSFSTITSTNHASLSEVLKHVVMHAFSAPSPNSNDPLFVNFRIKTKSTLLYNMIGMAVSKYLQSYLVAGRVTGDTTLDTLMQKIILVVDTQSSPSYANADYYPNCATVSTTASKTQTQTQCYNLANYVNVESGTRELRQYKCNSLLRQATNPPMVIDSDKPHTDVSLLRLVEPESAVDLGNTDALYLMLNYGAQFIPNRFYINDSNGKEYEAIFAKHRTAFVPFVDILHSSPQIQTR